MISIIIPIYNSESYLTQCLDSMINQTLKDIEIVCINDDSTDRSLPILQTYAAQDARIKIISQVNAGQAAARNTGLRNATGQYVMFCDSDDWYDPEMCSVMLENIEQHNVDFAMCDCTIFHEVPREGTEYHTLKTFGKYNLDETINKTKIQTLVWNKIFKNSLLQKYQIFFPENCNIEDVSFIIQYVSVSQSVLGIKNKLYNYRIRKNSIIDNLLQKTIKNNVLDSFHYTYDFFKKYNLWHKNYDYFIFEYYKQLTWITDVAETEREVQIFDEVRKNIIDFQFNLKKKDDPHQFFKLIYKRKYRKAKLFILSEAWIKYIFGFPFYKISIKDDGKNILHFIFDFKYLKIRTKGHKKIIYFLGLPVWVKKINRLSRIDI